MLIAAHPHTPHMYVRLHIRAATQQRRRGEHSRTGVWSHDSYQPARQRCILAWGGRGVQELQKDGRSVVVDQDTRAYYRLGKEGMSTSITVRITAPRHCLLFFLSFLYYFVCSGAGGGGYGRVHVCEHAHVCRMGPLFGQIIALVHNTQHKYVHVPPLGRASMTHGRRAPVEYAHHCRALHLY